MAIIEVKVPQLSESVAEATLLQWKKKPGEAVAADEILIEIETDKVVLEVPAPSAGVMAQIVKGDGASCTSDEVIAKIDTDGVATATAAAPAVTAPAAAAPAAGGGGFVVVFDDITQLISAQRSAAWGEVARRLAHEIKNPLTPIQLSAERLEMKLEGKLAEPERAILTKSVRTIVDQVDAMKRLVNEFRDYARLLKDSPRYAKVIEQGGSAQGFAVGLQRAGYATDPAYAAKLKRILGSEDLAQVRAELKGTSSRPI